MENEYAQLIQQTQAFIDLLCHAGNESSSDEVAGPHIEKLDFDQLRQLLSDLRERLEEARKIEREMETVRRRLAGRIASLRRGRKTLIDNGRSDDDALSGDGVPLVELMRIYEEETARLHRAASSPGRSVRGNSTIYRDYREFK
jgi:hypothetical protein